MSNAEELAGEVHVGWVKQSVGWSPHPSLSAGRYVPQGSDLRVQ